MRRTFMSIQDRARSDSDSTTQPASVDNVRSHGLIHESQGRWHEALSTFRWQAALDDGRTLRRSAQFLSIIRKVWRIGVSDAAGRVYLDKTMTGTKRQAS